MYYIIRFYRDKYKSSQVIEGGLTLEQARQHCKDKESSSSTCTNPTGKARTEIHGAWFDSYDEVVS